MHGLIGRRALGVTRVQRVDSSAGDSPLVSMAHLFAGFVATALLIAQSGFGLC